MSDDTSSALHLVTPPASELVTLDQAKTFLRIDNTADDDAVTRAITAARKFAEGYLRLALLPQSWGFSQANACLRTVPLPIGPAQSITSVTLTDQLGNVTTMDASLYRLSVDGFAVLFNNTPQAEILKITFSAGAYATAADVPAPIVQGILHHLTTILEHRDGAAALPMQSVNCYAPFRRVSL